MESLANVAMKFYYHVLIIGIVLSSCKNYFFLDDIYLRENRKERKFLESYQEQDSFCISKIEFDHLIDYRTNFTDGSISFNRKAIRDSLKQSFASEFHLSYCDFDEDHTIRKYGMNLLTDSFCNNTIKPKLMITSNSGKHIEGGGGLTFVEDMGDDEHMIEYKLVTSIYHHDTLVYKDNMAYWNTIYSARDEKVRYSVPQEVLDSLVSLSLEEYFKRVR